MEDLIVKNVDVMGDFITADKSRGAGNNRHLNFSKIILDMGIKW